MARPKRSNRRASGPAVERVHAKIRAEAATMWARLERVGRPAEPSEFPHVVALYHAALGSWNRSANVRRRSAFSYCGRTYRLEVTNMGRLRVLDGECLIVNGGPFAVD